MSEGQRLRLVKKSDAESREGLMREIEESIRAVLRDEGLEPAEKVKAIEAATRYLAIKHKVAPPEEEHFFARNRGGKL